jgi:hypothetical protein
VHISKLTIPCVGPDEFQVSLSWLSGELESERTDCGHFFARGRIMHGGWNQRARFRRGQCHFLTVSFLIGR